VQLLLDPNDDLERICGALGLRACLAADSGEVAWTVRGWEPISAEMASQAISAAKEFASEGPEPGGIEGGFRAVLWSNQDEEPLWLVYEAPQEAGNSANMLGGVTRWNWRPESGRFWVDPEPWRSATGLPAPSSIFELSSHLDRASVSRLQEALAEAMQSCGPSFGIEVCVGPERRWLQMNGGRPDADSKMMQGAFVSIQPRKRLEDLLAQSQARLEGISRHVSALIYIYNVKLACCAFCSQSSRSIIGYTPDEVLEMGSELFQRIIHPNDLERVASASDRVLKLSNEEKRSLEYRVCWPDGSVRWLRSIESVYSRDQDGTPVEIFGTAIDITHDVWIRDRIEEEILRTYEHSVHLHHENLELGKALTEVEGEKDEAAKAANTDPLTGLPNRRAFVRELETRLASPSRGRFCLAMIDLDHFKMINDTYGHASGDQVLKTFAKILAGYCDGKDTAARVGGEEFTLLIDLPSAAAAEKAASDLMDSIRTASWPFQKITASIGLAQSRPGECAADLFERADTALYASKTAGRNTISWPPQAQAA
jgi:diguanylate cyclase (GGDEF)-like protein/PAS domain S-box-containing protein